MLFLWSLLFFLQKSTAQNSGPKLRINPTEVYGGGASEYSKQIAYIPLEISKEGLFGDITQLIVTGKSYVIFDEDTKAVWSKLKEIMQKVYLKYPLPPGN